MHTTDTSRLRGRRGTSTIFGTLIFIAILFSAVIPMYLYMRQADALFEKRKHELNRLDEERDGENIHVYVYDDTVSESLTLRVENWGDLVVDIERIWINDTYNLLDNFNVQPENWREELTGLTAVPNTRYFIKVATDRGNVFSTESGSIYCDEDGNWETGLFTIYFFISYPASGWYDIDITYPGTETHVPGSPLLVHKSAHETSYTFHDVPTEGTYHVKITRSGEVIFNDDVIIPWPNGPTSVNVRA